jgi:hypothetical protein
LINSGDHASASERLDIMERRLSPTRRMQWPFFHHLRSVLEQRLGHSAAATQHAERAVALARELDLPALQLPRFLARLAQARAAMDDRGGAMRAIDEAIALTSPLERATFEKRRQLLQIEDDLEAGETGRASAALASVLAEQRARGLRIHAQSSGPCCALRQSCARARDRNGIRTHTDPTRGAGFAGRRRTCVAVSVADSSSADSS